MQEKRQKISPIKQRILFFADYLGISKRKFYSIIGVSRGTLESNTGITEDVAAKFIANYPDVSLDWLLTGKGEMLKSQSEASTVYNNVEEKKPPPAVPESEPVPAIYSMLIGRNESLARENGEMKAKIEQLKAENEQLKTEAEQLKAEIEQLKLKAESEELKKYERPLYDTAYSLSTPPMIAAEPEIEYK